MLFSPTADSPLTSCHESASEEVDMHANPQARIYLRPNLDESAGRGRAREPMTGERFGVINIQDSPFDSP
jgi:hypothetical protein